MKLTKNGETIEILSEKQAKVYMENGWAEIKKRIAKKPEQDKKKAEE